MDILYKSGKEFWGFVPAFGRFLCEKWGLTIEGKFHIMSKLLSRELLWECEMNIRV